MLLASQLFQYLSKFYNSKPIMCGVESTRAPSVPMKLMATSLVTRS